MRSYLAAVQNLDFRIGGDAAARLEHELTASLAKDRAGSVAAFHVWLTVRMVAPNQWHTRYRSSATYSDAKLHTGYADLRQ